MAQHVYFKTKRHKELGFDKPLLLKMHNVRKVVKSIIGRESIKDWVFNHGGNYKNCDYVEYINSALIFPNKTQDSVERKTALIESIRKEGIRVPLLTVEFGEEVVNELIASLNEKQLHVDSLLKRMKRAGSEFKYKTFEGGQRAAIAKMLGIEKVPALLFIVQPYTLD